MCEKSVDWAKETCIGLKFEKKHEYSLLYIICIKYIFSVQVLLKLSKQSL